MSKIQRDKFPSLNVILTGSKNGSSPNAPPYDQRRTEWNEEQEEFPRHTAYTLHKEFSKKNGHHTDVPKTNFFRSYVFAKAKNTATGWRYIPKKGVHSRQWRFVTNDGIIRVRQETSVAGVGEHAFRTHRVSHKLHVPSMCTWSS